MSLKIIFNTVQGNTAPLKCVLTNWLGFYNQKCMKWFHVRLHYNDIGGVSVEHTMPAGCSRVQLFPETNYSSTVWIMTSEVISWVRANTTLHKSCLLCLSCIPSVWVSDSCCLPGKKETQKYYYCNGGPANAVAVCIVMLVRSFLTNIKLNWY